MIRIILAAAAALALATSAYAGDDHKHGDGAKHEEKHSHGGKHGGKVVESGHHHLELVAKDGSLELYVEGEDGKPEDLTNAKATATVLAEGKKEDVALAVDAGNLLKGTGAFKAVKGTTIVVTLTMPDHKPEQARFKLD